MSKKSFIEWTESTWNPVTGCSKVSAGCRNCYAERMAKRLRGMGNPKYRNGFELTLHPNLLAEPIEWRKSQVIFVCSMSDLFHPKVPDSFIKQVFKVMNRATWHTFQILTKRAERLPSFASSVKWTSNIWLGVTVETMDYIQRASYLKKTLASVKFLSMEPLLGAIPNLPLQGIDWVIVGGESGLNSRPIEREWVRDIRDKCLTANVPFFFKQWGGINKKAAGRKLDGRIWGDMPNLSFAL